MEEMFEIEVETLFMPDENGNDVEYAICDDFEFEGKKYIVLCKVEGDAISDEDEIYMYEEDGEELLISSIEDEAEEEKVLAYYDQLCEEFDEDEE